MDMITYWKLFYLKFRQNQRNWIQVNNAINQYLTYNIIIKTELIIGIFAICVALHYISFSVSAEQWFVLTHTLFTVECFANKCRLNETYLRQIKSYIFASVDVVGFETEV